MKPESSLPDMARKLCVEPASDGSELMNLKAQTKLALSKTQFLRPSYRVPAVDPNSPEAAPHR